MLVQSGLVIARNECLEDEDGAVETTRVWITEAGACAGGAEGGAPTGKKKAPRGSGAASKRE
jgi:hypothetical protein